METGLRISVIGAGYVGLVTGACLADRGHDVMCVDVDCEKVEQINRGVSPIYEKGLDTLLARHIGGRLRASTDLPDAVRTTDVSFIAVGTRYKAGKIDLTEISQAADQVGRALKDLPRYHLTVVKSTVVPGTTEETVIPALRAASGREFGRDFGVAMNPEFFTEGQAVGDFMQPDRIVLGANDARTLRLLEEVYASFHGVPIVKTNIRTAEMIKYASNVLLATQISFSNELANLCSALGGVDVVEVMKGVHLSYYLSPSAGKGSRVQAPISAFLEAGCGYGGSCLPKDTKALLAHATRVGVPMPILRAVIETNERQPREILRLLERHFPILRGVRIGILGLAFKPETGDMQESPAIRIIRLLLAKGAILRAYDPVAVPEARKLFSPEQVAMCDRLSDAISGVQAVVLVTRWDEFKAVPDLLKHLNPGVLFVDGRRMMPKGEFSRYEGIGLSRSS